MSNKLSKVCQGAIPESINQHLRERAMLRRAYSFLVVGEKSDLQPFLPASG
jgi:hypothetical protein